MTEEEALAFHVNGLIGNVICRHTFQKLSWSQKPVAFSMHPMPLNPENHKKGAWMGTQQPHTGVLAASLMRTLEQSMYVHLGVLAKIGKKWVDDEKSR